MGKEKDVLSLIDEVENFIENDLGLLILDDESEKNIEQNSLLRRVYCKFYDEEFMDYYVYAISFGAYDDCEYMEIVIDDMGVSYAINRDNEYVSKSEFKREFDYIMKKTGLKRLM